MAIICSFQQIELDYYREGSPEVSRGTLLSLLSLFSRPNPLRLKSRLKLRVRFLNPSFIFAPVILSIGVVCARGSFSATELNAIERFVSKRDVELDD